MEVSSDEDPSYRVELLVTPTIGEGGRIELSNQLTLATAQGRWQRKLRFSSLLGTPASFSFDEADGTHVEFSVTPSLVTP